MAIEDIIAGGTRPVADYAAEAEKARALQQDNALAPQRAALLGEQVKEAQTKNALAQQNLREMAIVRSSLARNGGDFEKALADPDVLKNVNPNSVQGMLKIHNENSHLAAEAKKQLADAGESNAKTQAAELKYIGGLARSIRGLNYDPAATDAALLHAEQISPVYKDHIEQMRSTLGQSPTADAVRAMIDPIYEHSGAAAEDRELGAKEQTAKGASDRGAAALLQSQTNEGKQQLQQAATQLSIAAKKGPDQLRAALDALPHKVGRVFEGLTDADEILKVGMSPDQITTAAHQQKVDTQTASHNLVTEKQGAARIAQGAQRLKLDQERFGFDQGGGISLAAKAIADGSLDPKTARAMLRRSPGLLAQVKTVDPDFSEGNIEFRYDTQKEFTNTSTGKAGGQMIALNTLIHHAELYHEVADALKNGSFTPGNAVYNKVAQVFGSAPPTSAPLVARFLAGETGKVATGGVPAEGEINGILKSLNSNGSPEQMSAAANNLIRVAAGRATPLLDLAKKAKIADRVQLLGPDAKEILQRRGFDPETLKPVAGAAKGGATKPLVQHSESTGLYRYSLDGGKTWQTGQPPSQ